LKEGDVKTAMQRPDAVLLTEAMARKYFGTDAAIGKTLKMNNDLLLTVTGILAETPQNSHLQFDFILPIEFCLSCQRELADLPAGGAGGVGFRLGDGEL
jgi:putative ABC transport system permease protein